MVDVLVNILASSFDVLIAFVAGWTLLKQPVVIGDLVVKFLTAIKDKVFGKKDEVVIIEEKTEVD